MLRYVSVRPARSIAGAGAGDARGDRIGARLAYRVSIGLFAGGSIDGLADLAVDELTELTGMAAERAQDLIMKARAHWFEPAAETAAGA